MVTTNSEHPGLLLPLAVSGATVRVADVANRPAAEAPERIASMVGPKTRLLALSHVLWTTGQVMPVQELKRETGLPVLVDGAQSVGAIPVEVGEVDYYTVSGQKWLCGPEPLGALYIRDPDSLRIAFPAYWAQASIEPDGTFIPRENAGRFDTGWIATHMLAGWEAALDPARFVTVDRVDDLVDVGDDHLSRKELVQVPDIAGDQHQASDRRRSEPLARIVVIIKDRIKRQRGTSR